MRLALIALIAVTALPGCGEVAGTTTLGQAAATKPRAQLEKSCRTVRALATGFGEQNVTGLADSNLSLAIDQAKDEMASEGAKGFFVEGRTVRCGGYIDFGGAVGREHKCHASAQLCGKSG